MLSIEDNGQICRVGPGTPMGNLVRHHWIPGILSAELCEPASSPDHLLPAVSGE